MSNEKMTLIVHSEAFLFRFSIRLEHIHRLLTDGIDPSILPRLRSPQSNGFSPGLPLHYNPVPRPLLPVRGVGRRTSHLDARRRQVVVVLPPLSLEDTSLSGD